MLLTALAFVLLINSAIINHQITCPFLITGSYTSLFVLLMYIVCYISGHSVSTVKLGELVLEVDFSSVNIFL